MVCPIMRQRDHHLRSAAGNKSTPLAPFTPSGRCAGDRLTFLLTRIICNRIVTHYAKPIGYIFAGAYFPGIGRSHPSRCARLATPGKPACGQNRRVFSRLQACHLQALAAAAESASGRGETGRTPPFLSPQSRAAESCRSLAELLPRVLECELGQPQKLR